MTIFTGSEAWMVENGLLSLTEIAQKALILTLEGFQNQGESVVLVGSRSRLGESRILAIFGLADQIRPEAFNVISYLKSKNIDVWMITGDNSLTASSVGKAVGIPSTNIFSHVLPEQKSEKIQWLQERFVGCNVGMVGDGINDSIALARSNLGIAIGAGSGIPLILKTRCCY
jgi:P-type E1-E2 ATPase